MSVLLPIVVATPAHSGMGNALTYRSEQPLVAGTLVRVPLGAREVLGIVWDGAPEFETVSDAASDATTDASSAAMPTALHTRPSAAKTRDVIGALQGIAPLNAAWRNVVAFAARYYQRSIGEVALSALPPQLRELDATQLARRQKRRATTAPGAQRGGAQSADATISAPPDATNLIAACARQSWAIEQFALSKLPVLLWGATGSGKTEVYLRCVHDALATSKQAQCLVMVPEINLTPQLEERFKTRFEPLYGPGSVVAMHSGMTPAQRLQSWLAAHTGAARIVLGTRMAVLASIPGLCCIIVDEEHDPSYKSQDGARHSARDLAVYRARVEGERCKVMLGSATPSIETWQACEKGRYLRLDMPDRIGGGAPAAVKLVDMRLHPQKTLFAPALLAAIQERIARGEQSLIFLNRRGYAPVLACNACGWKSECAHCSAYRVFHKIDRTLRCHHCGLTERVPRACPDCGNIDIAPLGRGTEKLEEQLAQALHIQPAAVGHGQPSEPSSIPAAPLASPHAVPPPQQYLTRADGSPVVIARMDADTTKLKGALQQQLAQVHSGSVDILVGTQMIAKGHDFRRITLVAAINPDGALFSSDFRAPERLFCLLMQAAGRAGRDAQLAGAQMWVQTYHPEHPLFAALRKHDYAGFATQQLAERAQAGLPPFSFQALIRAEARTQEVAQAFLNAASAGAASVPAFEHVTLYPAVPMSLQRVANVERAQMLVESASRAALQKFLSEWQNVLRATKVKGIIRWAMDVDPLLI